MSLSSFVGSLLFYFFEHNFKRTLRYHLPSFLAALASTTGACFAATGAATTAVGGAFEAPLASFPLAAIASYKKDILVFKKKSAETSRDTFGAFPDNGLLATAAAILVFFSFPILIKSLVSFEFVELFCE